MIRLPIQDQQIWQLFDYLIRQAGMIGRNVGGDPVSHRRVIAAMAGGILIQACFDPARRSESGSTH
jgi:hypothetical protein